MFTRRPLLLSRSLPLPLLPLPSVNIAMHASPTVLAALHPPPTSLHPPTCLHHLLWLASILPSSPLPDLPVFCPLSSLPPALSVLVQPCPLFPQRLPFPLCRCPLTPLSSPPQSPSPSPADRGLVGTPKSSCSSLDCCPPSVPSFKVFFLSFPLLGWLITVASKLHTKSQHDGYCEADNGIQAVMAASNRRGFAL